MANLKTVRCNPLAFEKNCTSATIIITLPTRIKSVDFHKSV